MQSKIQIAFETRCLPSSLTPFSTQKLYKRLLFRSDTQVRKTVFMIAFRYIDVFFALKAAHLLPHCRFTSRRSFEDLWAKCSKRSASTLATNW